VNGKVWHTCGVTIARPGRPAQPTSAGQDKKKRPQPGTAETAPTDAAERLLRIQEVASELGLTARSIRYYEELGLLNPAARSEGAYRLYDASDVDRLRFIKALRDDAGFSLAEIGQLLEDEAARKRTKDAFLHSADPKERRSLVLDSLGRADRQVAILQSKLDRLHAMVEEATGRRDRLRRRLADLDAGGTGDVQ
jgi:DNA-binding transcriptional MerR regulator